MGVGINTYRDDRRPDGKLASIPIFWESEEARPDERAAEHGRRIGGRFRLSNASLACTHPHTWTEHFDV